jgi:hypothetical protein
LVGLLQQVPTDQGHFFVFHFNIIADYKTALQRFSSAGIFSMDKARLITPN